MNILLIILIIVLIFNYVPVGPINLGGNNYVGGILGIILLIVLLKVLGVF